MPCYSPLSAHQDTGGGRLDFSTHKPPNARHLQIACGQCYGCKSARAGEWTVRGTHEAKLHKHNSFLTLTYDDKHLPYRGQLLHEHYQLFMKRLRKQYGPSSARYYMCGEYGPQTCRPHFHAILFGIDWDDKEEHGTNHQGDKVYISKDLDRLWGLGQCTTGAVTPQSIGYVSRYIHQKRTGPIAEEWYRRWDELGEYQLEPEYNRMSLKPGIGANWLQNFQNDVFPHDRVIIEGKERPTPTYYDRLYELNHPDEMAAIREARAAKADANKWDNTPQRLLAKEIVDRARTKMLKRNTI